MKSRTNAQQELMRQQIIEEERNMQPLKCQTTKLYSSNKIGTVSSGKNVQLARDLTTKTYTVVGQNNLNKRQRSSSYSVTSDINSHFKSEAFSPNSDCQMDLAFSNLGNDDPLDWNQIEPSITTTSEISAQEILEQINRNDVIPEISMEEDEDSMDNNPHHVSPLKSSTSCPSNMASPYGVGSGGNPAVVINYGQFSQKQQQTQQTQQQQQSAANNRTVNSSGTAQIQGIIPSTVPDEQKLQWVRDRNKKDCHNRIERKRRDYINNQIQELGQLLPEKLFLSTESKRNKGGILKNSVLYIQQLQQAVGCIPQLQKEAQSAENAISAFHKRIQYLQDLLSSNGINYEQDVNDKNLIQEWFNFHQKNSQMLQNLNTIQSSWSSDNEKLSLYSNSEDLNVKEENISAENIFDSISISRTQNPSSGGGSSSGTPSATNFNSPLPSTPSTASTNAKCRNQPTATVSNINIINVTSPQQRSNQIYASSQPFNRTGIRLYEQSHPSKSGGVTDSPVLSSILIGSASTNSNSKVSSGGGGGGHDVYSPRNSHHIITGLSNSVPDSSRATILTSSTGIDGSERLYLIPISKAKGMHIVTADLKIPRNMVKVEADICISDDPVLSRIHSEASESPLFQRSILNSYGGSVGAGGIPDEEIHNCIEISPQQNDNDGGILGGFEFDDIPME